MHQPHLWELIAKIRENKFIDLTHTFSPGIPHATDMPDEVSGTLYDFAKDGFQAHRYEIAGQWGTHCDPPVHFIEGGRTIDQILPQEMIAPLVIFDMEHKVETNADYEFSIKDLEDWEQSNVQVPDGAFVILKTGWSKRWHSQDETNNLDSDGKRHSPGWSKEAIDFLCGDRNIVGVGHETLDTDPGFHIDQDEFPAEIAVFENDRYQIEALCNLDEVPVIGAIIMVSFPKPKNGSGFPARAIAIVPK